MDNKGEYHMPRPLLQALKPRIGEGIYGDAGGSAGFLCEYLSDSKLCV
jgi:hypothetical protein